MFLSAFAGALAAGSATAATWEIRQLTGEAAKVSMFGISCPSASLCVAVGGNNTIASSRNPGGGVESWKVVHAGAGAQPTAPGEIFPGRQVRDVSCPSEQLCVAVTFEGNVYTTNDPTGDAGAWAVTDLDGQGPNTHFRGVSCPTAGLCVAVAGGGRIATSTDPTGGAAAWSVVELDAAVQWQDVSCASPTSCVAVGDFGQVATSTAPTAGASAWTRSVVPEGGSHLYGVSCLAQPLCVTGNSGGNLLSSTDPLAAAPSWRMVDGGGSVQIEGASCVEPANCVAVDNNGDVLTSTDPSGGAEAWSFTNVIPFPEPGASEPHVGNHMFDVSCASASFCAIGANHGQVLTSSDPFAVTPQLAPKKQKGKGQRKKRRGPKRPRVAWGHLPHPGLETKRNWTGVRFRFYAKGRVPVRGFVCRLDRRPARSCRSPKSYRVGLGRHVFRVRAVGWSGLRGPVESFRFEVCHPTVRGWCLGSPKDAAASAPRSRRGASAGRLRA